MLFGGSHAFTLAWRSTLRRTSCDVYGIHALHDASLALSDLLAESILPVSRPRLLLLGSLSGTYDERNCFRSG